MSVLNESFLKINMPVVPDYRGVQVPLNRHLLNETDVKGTWYARYLDILRGEVPIRWFNGFDNLGRIRVRPPELMGKWDWLVLPRSESFTMYEPMGVGRSSYQKNFEEVEWE